MSCTSATTILAGNVAHSVVVFTRAGDDSIAGTTATVTVIELDGTEHAVTPDVDVDDTAGTVTVTGDWPIPAGQPAGLVVVRTAATGPLVAVHEDAFMVDAQT